MWQLISMLLSLLVLNFFCNFRTNDAIRQQIFLKAWMQHFAEPSASCFIHLQEMQTFPSVVHRFPSAFIKTQAVTSPLPKLHLVLSLFISYPSPCHTMIEQHHMNAVPLVRVYLYTQILCVLNILLHSHTSCISAAKIQ